MCLLAIQYKSSPDSPILVAQNREERFDRPSQAPRIQSGRPRVVCGIDRKGGGTWFGVNQHGLFVTVANARKSSVPADPRSRGLLCRELLGTKTAKDAADLAVKELRTGCYAGANFVCADAESASVVYGGEHVEAVELTPGLHLMTNGRMDDYRDERQEFVRRLLTLQRLDSAVAFLAVASRTFTRQPDETGKRGVLKMGSDVGTVSSALLSLSGRSQNSVLQYAGSLPNDTSYDDVSALLRQVLSTDR